MKNIGNLRAIIIRFPFFDFFDRVSVNGSLFLASNYEHNWHFRYWIIEFNEIFLQRVKHIYKIVAANFRTLISMIGLQFHNMWAIFYIELQIF